MSVVIAYDGSDEADAAVDAAVEEARLRGLPLHLVTAVAATTGEDPAQARAVLDGRTAAEERAVTAAARADGSGITVETHVVPAAGDVAQAILAVAREVGATLIVTGARRRSAVGKLLLGSVSRDLIIGADCSVLTARSAA